MAWKRALAHAAHRGGLFPAAGALFGGRRLTVLAYHRVAEHDDPGFDTYCRNVSATPEEFAGQMDYAAEHFHPVSLEQVEAALRRRPPPAPRAPCWSPSTTATATTSPPLCRCCGSGASR